MSNYPLRVSATALESFRLFCEPEQEWMTEADLVNTILRRGATSPAMVRGRAFGQILEAPEQFAVYGAADLLDEMVTAPKGYTCEGYTFDAAHIHDALARIERRGVFEAKGTIQIGDMLIVAKADHLYGRHLSEFKTTESFTFEKYADSMQWRLMVQIFDPLIVTYHVFKIADHENGVIDIRDCDSFNLYPYPGLHDDVAALVARFRHFVRARNLESNLRDFQRTAEV